MLSTSIHCLGSSWLVSLVLLQHLPLSTHGSPLVPYCTPPLRSVQNQWILRHRLPTSKRVMFEDSLWCVCRLVLWFVDYYQLVEVPFDKLIISTRDPPVRYIVMDFVFQVCCI